MNEFQAFTVRYGGKTNVLYSAVEVSQAFNANDPNVPKPQFHNVNAIWDTGASCTVITKKLAETIGLIPTGKSNVTGVNNSTEENTYLVNVLLPNKVGIMFLKIVEVPSLTGNAEMLIGMDIIGSGDFSVYLENGKTVMTYRFPSVGGTDFVSLPGNINNRTAINEPASNFSVPRKPLSNKRLRKRKQEHKNRKQARRNKKKK